MIFEVKAGEGEQFPAQETVLNEYEAAEKNFLKIKDVFDTSEI